jgi:hypothetical protein
MKEAARNTLHVPVKSMHRFILSISGISLIALVFQLLIPPKEPDYNGKLLNEWLEGLHAGASLRTQMEAEEAIRHKRSLSFSVHHRES